MSKQDDQSKRTAPDEAAKLLVYRKYQLRYALVGAGASFLLCAALGGMLVWQNRGASEELSTLRTKSTQLHKKLRTASAADFKRLAKSATDMFKVLAASRDDSVKRSAGEAFKALEADDRAQQKRREAADAKLLAQQRAHNKAASARRAESERNLILAVVLFSLVFIGGVFVLYIYETRRVARLLATMHQLIERIRDGRLSSFKLPDANPLAEVVVSLKEMHESLREQNARDIAAMEAALATCREQGVASAAVDDLAEAVQKKRRATVSGGSLPVVKLPGE